MSEELEQRVQRAVEYFMKGYGCGQSVVAAFADLYGMDEATALKIGNGFGGGVGKMRMMCGAVSGLVILAGLESGKASDESASCAQADSEDNATVIRKDKAECYKLVQDLLESFRVANGSIICAELLGLSGKPATGEHGQYGLKTGDFTPSERNAEYYKARPCAAKVESAARIFAEYLSSK